MRPEINFRLFMHNCYATFLGLLVAVYAQRIGSLTVPSSTKSRSGVFSFLGSL